MALEHLIYSGVLLLKVIDWVLFVQVINWTNGVDK